MKAQTNHKTDIFMNYVSSTFTDIDLKILLIFYKPGPLPKHLSPPPITCWPDPLSGGDSPPEDPVPEKPWIITLDFM